MTPAERRRRAIKAIRAARKRRGLQKDEVVTRIAATLIELQAQIRLVLEGQPTEFNAGWLPELLREVDDHVDRWLPRARGEVKDGLEAAAELGPEIVDAAFTAADRVLPRVLIPSSLLEELVIDGLDFIDDLGPVAKNRIRRELELGLLGGKSPADVMVAIGDDVSAGPFRFIHFRAETITRTEMGRVHSKAGQRRMEDALEHVPELGKEWVWSGKSRMSHSAANGQTRPVKEAFDVAGEKLMHPRDPAGSAANTINCACDAVPWMASW